MQNKSKNTFLNNTMQINKNQTPILFENGFIKKSKFTFKHFFLSNYFSKNALKTQNSSFLPTFFKIKPHVFVDKNVLTLNLKKNKQFLRHSKKNCFFITFLKQNEQTISEKFLNLYFKTLKSCSHQKEKNMLKKINFNRSYTQIQTKISQTQYYESLKQHCVCLYQLLIVHHIDFLKKNFLWLFSIVFLNKQIHRFLHFYLFSKQTENYYFSRFCRFFLNFYFLNIFLFNYLYDSAKKQHLNNSNAWIFNKHWLFLQPFPYFFDNSFSPVYPKVSLKKTASQPMTNLYFFMIDQTLFHSNLNKNFFFSYANHFLEIILHSFVQNYVKTKISHNKGYMLKTYYLDSYKTSYIFKANTKNKEKKYSLYFISIKSNVFKFFILTLKLNSSFRKKKTHKRLNVTTFNYAFLKFYIMTHKFNS